MEKLRTILCAAMALVLSVGFVSCSDDDEPADGVSNGGRKLISIYEPKYGEYEYLDPVWENGKLVSYIDGIDESDRMSIVYLDNNKASVKLSADDDTPSIITLDANGHMTDGWDTKIAYNSDGQMVWYTRDYCDLLMDYSGGDAIKYEKNINDNYGRTDIVQFVYTNSEISTPIENKGGILMISDLSILDDFEYLCWFGIFGKASKHLPVEVIWESDPGSDPYSSPKREVYEYEWVLDEQGYPVKCIKNGDVIYEYEWE